MTQPGGFIRPPLGKALADPPDRSPYEWAAMPAPSDHVSAKGAEPIAGDDKRPTPGPILDLPGPLAHGVGAADAQGDLGVVAQVDQPRRILDRSTAPALRGRHVGVFDRGSDLAHRFSLCRGGLYR
jgi:hypothetical protein